jgi:hypothetical protein
MLFRFDSFAGFSPEDFAAFEERKWASNRFNLERMKTRARMDALGRALQERMGEALAGLALHTTLDHPHIFNRNTVRYLRLCLDRLEEERLELTRVADRDLSLKQKVEDSTPEDLVSLCGVEIALAGITLFLTLPACALPDRRNLAARLADPAEAQQFAVLLARLPPGFAMTFDGAPPDAPRPPATLAGFRQALDDCNCTIRLQQTIPRAEPLLAQAALADRLAQWLPPLLAVWRFGAWSRTNDRLKLAKALKEEKKTLAKRQTGLEAGDEVSIVSGLLAGKSGTVVEVALNGRVKLQVGRVTIDMDPKMLKKQ